MSASDSPRTPGPSSPCTGSCAPGRSSFPSIRLLRHSSPGPWSRMPRSPRCSSMRAPTTGSTRGRSRGRVFGWWSSTARPLTPQRVLGGRRRRGRDPRAPCRRPRRPRVHHLHVRFDRPAEGHRAHPCERARVRRARRRSPPALSARSGRPGCRRSTSTCRPSSCTRRRWLGPRWWSSGRPSSASRPASRRGRRTSGSRCGTRCRHCSARSSSGARSTPAI